MTKFEEQKNNILNDQVVDLEGLTCNEYKELIEFAEKENKEIKVYYSIDEGLEDCGDSKIVLKKIINPENNQRLIDCYVILEDVDYHEAVQQLTLTFQYHMWNNTFADSLYDLCNDIFQERKDEDEYKDRLTTLINIYNEFVEKANVYSDFEVVPMNADIYEIMEIIERNDC